MTDRQNKALTVLRSYKDVNYSYLSEGQDGVVFTDGIKVYKVYESILTEAQRMPLEANCDLHHNTVKTIGYEKNIVEIPFNQLQNLDSLFYISLAKGLYLSQVEVNYLEPDSVKLHYREVKPFRETVSLIVKACLQDYETIYAMVKHIVKQLSAPDTFLEKIVAIDIKERDFTREYTNKGTLKDLIHQVNRLIEEQIVDKYVILPTEEITDINNRWFGIKANATHCTQKTNIPFPIDSGVPVTPQLYAFEQAKGKYIFQMDSDVMIARKDLSHSYLEDMVSEMEKNEKVVSVGFNICQNFDIDYKPYFGFKDGGFVPEVRMGLFHKERFLSMRPFPNKLDTSNNWTLSWYRAMEQRQKETGYCSIRGGDSRSFFVHPQNYRKTNADVWTTILDRVESGYIPYCQQLEFDCAGSYYDWTIPKREEKLVILCCLRNVEYVRFLKMFCSVVSQTYQDWGMIIVDDASDNGLPIFIDNIIKPYMSKITFIKNRVRQSLMENIYKAVHYFVDNPEPVIVIVDADDTIISNEIFWKILWHYDVGDTDVVIGNGKIYQKKTHFSVFKGRRTFLPNLNKIEIDITYKCNLKCIACNRSCSQAPTNEQIEFADIERFIAESIELGKKWDLINILGGEPTLHPDFEKIIKYISERYIILHSPKTHLQIVSNGLTEYTRNLLEEVKNYKNVSIDYGSFKKNNKIEYFSPFNDAPIDDDNFKNVDYSKACWVTNYCGIGLNKFGYYGCSVCGGIDRIVNENRDGIKYLKDISIEKFQEQFFKFCGLCGNFKDYDVNEGNVIPRCEKAPLKRDFVSKTWNDLYNRYNKRSRK